MKPSARIQAAIEILQNVEVSPVPMDTTMGDYMRGRRYIGAKDRANIAERVYAVTRAHARIGWWLSYFQAPDTARMRIAAYLALAEAQNQKRIEDLFDGSRYSPEELTQQEKEFLQIVIPPEDAKQVIIGNSLIHPEMPEAARVECPPEFEEKLRKYFGADFAAEMEAMLHPATLDLRVNVFLIPRVKAKESLSKDGVETMETPYSPWGLRAAGKAFLSKTKAFHKGLISIQDEGSQLIALICGAKPGMQVLDFCAGAGGKTLALASAMNRKGRIVAMDTDERRLEKGRMRFRKAQISDIIEIRPLSDERHRKWLRRQKETFDIVLVDAPCTGTGTWRRNPDMRWKEYGPRLEELVQVQADILDKVAGCVKPGGKLVYATCSLLLSENEDQVAAFLSRHPGFEVAPPEDARLGTPYMRLTPLRHQTDGFFGAVLRKQYRRSSLKSDDLTQPSSPESPKAVLRRSSPSGSP